MLLFFHTGCLREVEVQLRPLCPKNFVKFSSLSCEADLFTLTDQGDLLLHGNNELCVMDIHFKKEKAKLSTKGDDVRCIAQSKDKVFVVTYKNHYLLLSTYNYKLVKKQDICEFRTGCPSSHCVVVSNSEAIIIDNSSYSFQLHIFDVSRLTASKRSVQLREKAKNIYMLPDQKLLIANDSGTVGMYDISSATAVEIWKNNSCNTYLSTDAAGLCYSTILSHSTSVTLKIFLCKAGKLIFLLCLCRAMLFSCSHVKLSKKFY